MKAVKTPISDVLIIEPDVIGDNRGYFFESYNHRKFTKLLGRELEFVQDNHSHSVKNVLRGMHYQIQHTQAKLVSVINGKILDISVDLRKNSPTFKQHVVNELSSDNKRMLWIPEGFAHGFVVLSNTADLLYKTTDYRYPEHERCIRWNDPDLAINWQLKAPPILSDKDVQGQAFAKAELFD